MEVREKQPTIVELANTIKQAEKEFLDLKAEYMQVRAELEEYKTMQKQIYPLVVAHILSHKKLELTVTDKVMLNYQTFLAPIEVESTRNIKGGQVFNLRIKGGD